MAAIDNNINKRSARPARRRRGPAEARDNILTAAESMLTAHGPQSLKLAQVARAAGVSNASVLHHFSSIDGVQAALMERMVRNLVADILGVADSPADSLQGVSASVTALFDAFESRGAARLAAWLELTGESRRLTGVRGAVREEFDRRKAQFPAVPGEGLEDFLLVCITLALGVGLFGSTLGELLGRPADRVRHVALALVLGQIQATLRPV